MLALSTTQSMPLTRIQSSTDLLSDAIYRKLYINPE